MTAHPRHSKPGEVERLSPLIERILEDNPGPFTGLGTNTFIIGDREIFVLDPGEERHDGHSEVLLRAVGDRTVKGVLVSHHHRDHWPLAAPLARRWKAPVLGFEKRGGFSPDICLKDGQRLEGTSFGLRVLHTPGHCADHLCFSLEPNGEATDAETESEPREHGVIFCADLVMAWATTVLAPPDGNLVHYLSSLERLIELEPSLLLPAHGSEITDPVGRMKALHAHRLERTSQVLEALIGGPATLSHLVAIVYAQTDPKLHGAAAASLRAHLDALVERGRVHELDGVFRLM